MDVGSNHGLYSLFAAKLGADVITLEPQERLCRVINKAALLNGKEVAIIPLILSLLPLVYPLALLVPSVRLPFLSEYRDAYYLNLLFLVRGCARNAQVAQRITLYHAAALDHREVITMSAAEVAEGAVATVVRAGK